MVDRRHFAVLALVALTVAGTSWRFAIEAAPAAPPLVAPETLVETGLYADGDVNRIDPGRIALIEWARRFPESYADFPKDCPASAP